MNHDVSLKSRLHAWVDVTVDEMYIFLAVNMHFSFNKKRKLADYWSKDPLLESPVFGNIMSVNRYTLISRCLHFADN